MGCLPETESTHICEGGKNPGLNLALWLRRRDQILSIKKVVNAHQYLYKAPVLSQTVLLETE